MRIWHVTLYGKDIWIHGLIAMVDKLVNRIVEELGVESIPSLNLVLTTPKEYNKANVALAEYLVNNVGIPGVYVTLNKPYKSMKDALQDRVDMRMIIFIDVITKPTGGKMIDEDKCLYLDNIHNLSDLGVAIDRALESIPGDSKFLLFDSLATLEIYNKVDTVLKFIYFLSGKIRSKSINGIFLSLERSADEDMISQLSMFCDQVVHLGE